MPTTQTGWWTVAVAGTQYFTASTAAVSLTVALPNYITNFRASLSPFAVVTVKACIGAGTGTVNVQYAAGPSGPWRTLGRLKPDYLTCAHGSGFGNEYKTNFGARLGAAYYRVVYPASYSYQGVTSKAVYLAKHFTKITSFKVSPRSVARGSKFTVSGRLWAQGKHGKWTPYAHRRLLIIFRYQGVYYRYAAEPKTNAAGRFSGRFAVLVTAPVFAQYNGDSTHFASATKRITVRRAGADRAPSTRGAVRAPHQPRAGDPPRALS